MIIDIVRSKSADIMKKAAADYQALRSADQKAKAETMKPGETMGYPTFNNFYSADYKNKCDEVLTGYRSEIRSLLDEVRTEIKTKSAEPPTTEQANLLTALSVGKPTKEELQNALETNTGNFPTFSAIHRIARDNDIVLDESKNPLADLQALQMELATNESNLYTNNAEKRLSASYIAFSEMFN